MAIKLKHSSIYSTYFCTFTCYDWINLFDIIKGYDLVYKWFYYLKENSNGNVLSYVIMPNHMHCILYFSDEEFQLNKIIGNAKRFIAYEIIERLEAQNHLPILKILKEGLTERERRKGQLHKVFEESFDAKPIFSNKFLLQKINYIHYNPISGKWHLVDDFTDYEHSSASFYELGLVKQFKPLHYLEL